MQLSDRLLPPAWIRVCSLAALPTVTCDHPGMLLCCCRCALDGLLAGGLSPSQLIAVSRNPNGAAAEAIKAQGVEVRVSSWAVQGCCACVQCQEQLLHCSTAVPACVMGAAAPAAWLFWHAHGGHAVEASVPLLTALGHKLGSCNSVVILQL